MACTITEGTLFLCSPNENQIILSPASNFSSDENSSNSEPKRRGRKRCLDHLSLEEKILRKKLKNREAAQVSRDRKKARMDQLEYTMELLIKENKESAAESKKWKSKVRELAQENERLKLKNRELAQENERLKSNSNTDTNSSASSCNCSRFSQKKRESIRDTLSELVSDITQRPAVSDTPLQKEVVGVSSRPDPVSPLSLPDLDLDHSKEEWDWLFESTPALDFTLLENLANDLFTLSSESQPAEDKNAEMVGSPSKLLESSCSGECSTACLNLKESSCKISKSCEKESHTLSNYSLNQNSQASKLSNSIVPLVDCTDSKESNIASSEPRRIRVKTVKTGSNIACKKNGRTYLRSKGEPKIVMKPKRIVAKLQTILPKTNAPQLSNCAVVNVNQKISSTNELSDIPMIIVEDVGLVEEVSTCTDDNRLSPDPSELPKKEEDFSDCSVEAYCDQVVNNFDRIFKVELDNHDAMIESERMMKTMNSNILEVSDLGKESLSDSYSDNGYDSLDSPLSDNNEYLTSMELFPNLLE